MSARERNALKRKAKHLARKGSAARPAPSKAAAKRGPAAVVMSTPPAVEMNGGALAPEYELDAAHDDQEWAAVQHGRCAQTCAHVVMNVLTMHGCLFHYRPVVQRKRQTPLCHHTVIQVAICATACAAMPRSPGSLLGGQARCCCWPARAANQTGRQRWCMGARAAAAHRMVHPWHAWTTVRRFDECVVNVIVWF